MATVDKSRLARFTADAAGGGDFVKINFFKFDSGVVRLRFLPGQEPGTVDKDFYVKTMLHYGAAPANPKQYIICPKTLSPKAPCPVCSEVARLKESTSKFDEAEVTKLKAKARFAIGVLLRDGKQADQICVYMAPKTIIQQVLDYMNNEDYGDITHPTEGYDVRITKKGDGRNTTYTIQAAKKASPIVDDEDQLKEILAGQPELWRFRYAPEAAEIQALLDGEITSITTGFGYNVPFKKKEDAEEPESEEPEPEDDFAEEKVPEDPKPNIKDIEAAVQASMNRKGFSNIDSLKKKLAKD